MIIYLSLLYHKITNKVAPIPNLSRTQIISISTVENLISQYQLLEILTLSSKLKFVNPGNYF